MADNLRNVFLKIKSNKNTLNIALISVIFIVMYAAMMFGLINRYNSTIFILVLVSIIMATSLNIATGFLGQLVLGHAGFMAIGAYVAALLGILLRDVIQFSFLSDGLNNLLLFIISALGAGVFAAIAGIIVGFPALRLRGDYLGIMTLGFGEIVRALITNLEITNGAQGLSGIPRIMNFPIAFWSTVLIVVFVYLFMNSRHGRAILSIREDEIASESVGTDITKYKLIGFILASGFGGIGGAIYAFQIGYLAPSAFGFVKSVDIFVIVVLGGMGSISGGIIAAIFLTFLPEYLREFNQYRLLLYSMLLIFTMLFRPKGLMGTKEFSAKEFITKTIKIVPQLPRLFLEFVKKSVDALKQIPNKIVVFSKKFMEFVKQIPKYIVQVVKNFVKWIKTKLSRKDRD